MKDTDFKHLILKTSFLLALASSKCSNEIHAGVATKYPIKVNGKKVALFHSLVIIPALTTIWDRQFKEDRALRPVQALRYYLDRTKDLTGSQSLLFISFKKGHASDIRSTIFSFWLKQTILLCYKQADQQSLDLVQVKTHALGPSWSLRPFTVGF